MYVIQLPSLVLQMFLLKMLKVVCLLSYNISASSIVDTIIEFEKVSK